MLFIGESFDNYIIKSVLCQCCVVIKCAYYDVSELTDDLLYEKGLAEVSSERAEKVKKYRFDKDRRLSLGAGLLLKYMLTDMGVPAQIHYNEFGKPYLKGKDVHFNISHDGKYALCAAAHIPVGADVQKLTEYDPRLTEAVFCPDEIVYIENSADKDRAFTRLWTRKESYIKLIGTGMSADLRSFSVLDDGTAYYNETETEEHLICVCSFERTDIDFYEWKYSGVQKC